MEYLLLFREISDSLVLLKNYQKYAPPFQPYKLVKQAPLSGEPLSSKAL
jgi:hypothetical protein